MSDIVNRLILFENLGLDKSNLMLELPYDCFVGKIYFVTEGRNAWNGTWSTKYVADSSFQVRMSDAQDEVERRRVQGSQWTIRELACCVFEADAYSLIVTEINTSHPLSRFILRGKSPGASLHKLAIELSTPYENRVIRLVTRSPGVQKHDGSSQIHASRSNGARVRLTWRELGSAHDIRRHDNTHVIRVAEEAQTLLRLPVSA